MRTLELTGIVRTKSQGIVLPGRDKLFLRPDDWPAQLTPGTLTVEANELPPELDDGTTFRPALVIPARHIIGSLLQPDSDHPTRGFASVWRAEIQVVGAGQVGKCWMFRIIGSDATAEVNLVAEDDLRGRLKLGDGAAVKVTVWEAESNRKPPTPHEIVAGWVEAARNVEAEFGRDKAMAYLIGEKFLNFLEIAEKDREWRAAIPAFVAEIKGTFEQWQLGAYLEKARMTERFDPSDHDSEFVEMERQEELRRGAADLLLIEQARDWLLDEREE